MVSVFREKEWTKNRHFLNPSRWKEYELHAVGLGFLNKINPFKDYKERFTHIDDLNLGGLHKKTTLHLIRKDVGESWDDYDLVSNGFRCVRTWGTIVQDLSKPIVLDKENRALIRKAEEKGYEFFLVSKEEQLREYWELFRDNRKMLGMGTPNFSYFWDLWTICGLYNVFIVKYQDKVVAGLGLIANPNGYALQCNVVSNKSVVGCGDFLTFKVLNWCKTVGVGWFDFAGVNPTPIKGSKDEGIRRYKEKWGGSYYHEFVYRRR